MERLAQSFTKQKSVLFLILNSFFFLSKVLFYLNLLQSPIAAKSYYRKSFPSAGSQPLNTVDNASSYASHNPMKFPTARQAPQRAVGWVLQKEPGEPHRQGRLTAVAAAVLMRLLLGSEVHDSQEVK